MGTILILLALAGDDFQWSITERPTFGPTCGPTFHPTFHPTFQWFITDGPTCGPTFQWVVAEEKALPEVRMYAPESCAICDQLFAEIEQAGGEQILPFKLVKVPLLNWMNDGPWFYWKNPKSPSGWSRLHGLNTLNGKRLDWLLREWTKDQPESRKVESQAVSVCCCEGSNTQSCLCLEEIRKGVKRGPCTCNSRYGSRHFMQDEKPIGPAGGYSELTAETKRLRRQSQSYCPNCQRR